MKTFTATPDDIHHEWLSWTPQDVPLGRLASDVAQLIRGKHKPTFTPHMDGGDFVIVINAAKVRLTGTQARQQDLLQAHRLHGSRDATRPPANMMAKHPDRVIEKAVFGMLPKNSLAKQQLRGKLKVYAGAEHPHAAQQPKPYTVTPHPEGERMSGISRIPLAGRRPPQDQRRPRVPDARHRQVGHQRPHARRLLPAPSLVQHIQQSFTATDTLGAFDVQGARGRRRAGGPGRRAAARASRAPWWRPTASTGPSCGPPGS